MSAELPSRSESKPQCRHCGKETSFGRPRGICHKCYQDDAIRAKFPPRQNQHGGTNGTGGNWSLPPGPPTRTLPGTEERLLVLCQRVELHLPVHSPGDAALPLD